VGMDYLSHVEVRRHTSWTAYLAWRKDAGGDAAGNPGRLILLSTQAALPYAEAQYGPADSLLVGQESAGVPDMVRNAADLAVRIPMRPGLRSLNVAMAAAIVAGEAIRQVGFPNT
jgi:tRNA (cytidine/uridine-2'-O-)-methyltransferase